MQSKNILWILRVEGLIWFLLSLYLFDYFQGSWWLFVAMFFIPDLSLVGYLFGPKKGAIFYNTMHTEIGPLILVLCGLTFQTFVFLPFAIIWFCHINFDRMLGLGLKYPSGFKMTHLGTFDFFNKGL